jgi:hypothetical protein
MRDPRDSGHGPDICSACGSGCDYVACVECGEGWPCPPVAEYDAKIERRERRKRLPDELDALAKRVNALELDLTRARAHVRYLELFVLGAALPIFRDLLATHATGSLEMPSAREWISGDEQRNVESGMGVGVDFKSGAGAYVYKATDGRIYTDGRVTRGADVSKVAEQRRRMGQ